MKFVFLFAALLPMASQPSKQITFKVEDKDHVQSYLPVHFKLERGDGGTIDLKPSDVMKCYADGHDFIVCDQIEYKIVGVDFEVE